MSPTAFLDANVPIYAAGAPHPHREPCIEILDLAYLHPQSFVTNAEVLQELIHRYRSRREWSSIGSPVFASFAALMGGRIEAVYAQDARVAAELADRDVRASARDLIHAATMRRIGIELIVSADKQFDGVPGVTRLDPLDVDAWRDSVVGDESGSGAAP